MRRLPLALSFVLFAAACEPGLQAQDTAQISVAGGSFSMGSPAACTDERGTSCAGDRAPHAVKLSPFSMDATEVTRLQYAACVVAGRCRGEDAPDFDSEHPNDPVLVDDPAAARAYCDWKMLRLPTEAEFELAARGGDASALKAYPWGDDAPTCDDLPHAGCKTVPPVGPVGSNKKDVTASGIHDLAGSAPEWVDDGYTPYAGCLDRLSYGEICWGASADCAAARCMADGSSCASGCLPAADDVAGAAIAVDNTSSPICPLAGSTVVASDPVLREASAFSVVRGAGPADRACQAAGFSRRHATPRRFSAGFRCVKGGAPVEELTYRFTTTNCPAPLYPIGIVVKDAMGAPVEFALDAIPTVGTEGGQQLASMQGRVDGVPCGTVFVVRPTGTPSQITVSVDDMANMCVSGAQPVDLSPGGDVPSVGLDEIRLAGGAACLPKASCSDQTKNGLETDVDCGGPSCGPCATGKACQLATDCTSHSCLGGVCSASTCSDNVLDGTETDVDCGGMCPGCPAGAVCKVDSDCTTSWCKGGKCAVPSCTDSIKNGKETDVDCGGGTCPACQATNSCKVDADCQSQDCAQGKCVDVLTIVTRSPAPGATNVATDGEITAVFSEILDPSTVTSATFFLDNGASGTVSVDQSGKQVHFAPSSPLAPGTLYTAHVTTGIQSVTGATLRMETTWQFTTAGTAPGDAAGPVDLGADAAAMDAGAPDA